MKAIILIVIVLFLFAGTVQAADCVAPVSVTTVSPSSCPGIMPGDTIYIEAGNRGYLQIRDIQGEEGNPITIINSGGLVDIDANGGWVGIWVRNSEHIRITGTGSADEYGISVHNSSNMGVFGQEKTRYIEIDHIEITDVNIGVSVKTNNDISGNPVLRGTWVQYNTTIHNCYIHNIRGEAMYLGSSYWKDGVHSELDGVYIYDNIIENIGFDGIQISSAPYNVEVHHNLCVSSGQSMEGNPPTGANNVAGFFIGEGTAGKWYNNKIIDSGGRGIWVSPAPGEVEIFNNLIVNTGVMGWDGISHGMAVGNEGIYEYNTVINPKNNGINVFWGSATVRDNIIVGYGESAVTGGDAYNNIESNSLDTIGFVDPGENDFHLLSNSMAVDKGSNSSYPAFDLDDVSRSQGSAPDIGAYEYTGDVTPTCTNQGYRCCSSCESNPHPEYDADCTGQVCCDTCYVQSFLPEQYIEAEDGELILPMQIGSDSSASGGQYVFSDTNEQGSVSYTFNISETDQYMMQAKVLTLSITGSDDSFYIGLDAETAQGNEEYAYDTLNTDIFAWDDVSLRGIGGVWPSNQTGVKIWNLTSGTHTFTFYCREDNTWLDQIILKKVSGSSCGDADTNTDGTVDILEIMDYMASWKAGSVTIENLMIGIGEWKNGCA